MDKELNYQQARRIRQNSVASLFADQLISGKGYKEGFKNVLSLKSKAVSKGLKEKFDPLNIAKVLTGGSRLGPALVGKILGRSKKDIEYFAGKAMPIFEKISKLSNMDTEEDEEEDKGKKGKKDNLKGVKTVLNKILTFLNKSHDAEVARHEKESNFKEANKLDDDRRHNELLKVLAGLSAEENDPKKGPHKFKDVFKNLKEKIKLKIDQKLIKSGTQAVVQEVARKTVTTEVAEKAATTVAQIEAKRVAAKEIANALLAKSALFTATRIIPGVSLATGLYKGAKSAMEGDWRGVGYNIASGAVTTVPYFTLNPVAIGGGAVASGAIDIYQGIREVYHQVWGVWPEDDKNSPEFDAKMKVVTDAVKSIVGPSAKWDVDKGIPPEKISEEIDKSTTKINQLDKQIAEADPLYSNEPGARKKWIALRAEKEAEEKRLKKLGLMASHNERTEAIKEKFQSEIDRINDIPLDKKDDSTDSTSNAKATATAVSGDTEKLKIDARNGNFKYDTAKNAGVIESKGNEVKPESNKVKPKVKPVIPSGWTIEELEKDGFLYDEGSKNWAVKKENEKSPGLPDVYEAGEGGILIKKYFDGNTQKQIKIPYTHKRVSALPGDTNGVYHAAQHQNNDLNLDSNTSSSTNPIQGNTQKINAKPDFRPIAIASVRPENKTLNSILQKETVVV
jgi:hypothetical protein